MTTFAALGLPRALVDTLAQQGMDSPFPIQSATIPDVLAGKDLLGRAPTGSGKTLGFGLPMLARLGDKGVSRPGKPRGLILAPTRELATQIQERLDDLAASLNLRTLAVVGGVNINNHIWQLARPVDVLVATPGRAQDLINQGYLDLSQVEITTLDEADQMADMGFLPQVKKLLALTPARGQRLLFSATLDAAVEEVVNAYLHSPVEHSTAPVEAAVDTMEHYVFYVGERPQRNDIVLTIAARAGKTIMFMRTKHGVDRQTKKLRRNGINALPLHGDKGQGARTRAIEGFRAGSVPVLVATDIAARGIDISGVSLVVHVDPPAEHKAYLHRAGRTARGGESGTVVTLGMEQQRDEITQLLRKAGVDATVVELSDSADPIHDPRLIEVTGATTPPGTPLPAPGQQLPAGSAKSRKASSERQPGAKKPRRRGGGSKRGGSNNGGNRGQKKATGPNRTNKRAGANRKNPRRK